MNKINSYIIIDDDSTNNLICRMTIERVNRAAQVHSFTDPAEGLAFLKSEEIKSSKNILLLDINMPGISGWDILTEYGTWPLDVRKHILVYLLTSSIDEIDRQRAKEEFNVTNFISKPLLKEQVEAMNNVD